MDKEIEELRDLVSDMCLPTPDHIAAIRTAIKIMERLNEDRIARIVLPWLVVAYSPNGLKESKRLAASICAEIRK